MVHNSELIAKTAEEAERLARKVGLPVRVTLVCEGTVPQGCREIFAYVPSTRAVRVAFGALVVQLERAGQRHRFHGVRIELMR
jgi:hypothetical protein